MSWAWLTDAPMPPSVVLFVRLCSGGKITFLIHENTKTNFVLFAGQLRIFVWLTVRNYSYDDIPLIPFVTSLAGQQ